MIMNSIEELEMEAELSAKYLKEYIPSGNVQGLGHFSDLIMEKSRKKCIYLPMQYYKTFFNKKTVTIDPSKIVVKFTENLGNYYFPLYANSFGPFNAYQYFRKPIRFLFLLKESFRREFLSWDVKIGHNQSEEFGTWEKIMNENNKTLITLIKITKVCLESFYSRPFNCEETMEHICVLEVNSYPGLAYNIHTQSDNKLVYSWCKINKEFIKELIVLYQPSFVLSCNNILSILVDSITDNKDICTWANEHLFNWLRVHNIIGNKFEEQKYSYFLLGHKIINSYNRHIYGIKDKDYNRVTIVMDTNQTIWIGCYHPAYGKWKSHKVFYNFARFVSDVYNQRNSIYSKDSQY